MRRRAFTLIELLVVISVLSLLMAVLIPAMARARQQGRKAVCLSNLRQMAIAAEVYAQQFDGYYPISQYTKMTRGRNFWYQWDFTLIFESGSVTLVPGLLWRKEMIGEIQQCPSFKGDSNTQYDPYTGYNYNTSYIGHGQGEYIPTPAKVSQVRRPGECALFGDGQCSSGANKFMRCPLRSPADRTFNARFAGTQGYRHSGKTNVVWCDGHASSEKQLYTNIEPAHQRRLIEKYNDTAKNKIGFLSPDNSAYDLE